MHHFPLLLTVGMIQWPDLPIVMGGALELSSPKLHIAFYQGVFTTAVEKEPAQSLTGMLISLAGHLLSVLGLCSYLFISLLENIFKL